MGDIFKRKSGSQILIEVLAYVALSLVFIIACIDVAYAGGRNDAQQQKQMQGQDQVQDQTQSQSANANAAASVLSVQDQDQANTQSINFNGPELPDDITIRNTASANMPNLTATSPCVLSWSAGIGLAGANIGGGKAKIDPECNIRETARTFAGLGEIELALAIACTSEVASAALGDRCGLSANNVYVKVNEPVRYVERLTRGVEAFDDTATEHAVEVCSEATSRAFEQCVESK